MNESATSGIALASVRLTGPYCPEVSSGTESSSINSISIVNHQPLIFFLKKYWHSQKVYRKLSLLSEVGFRKTWNISVVLPLTVTFNSTPLYFQSLLGFCTSL